MDHDRRFKTLLQEFFPELLRLFWPELAARFDFATLAWIDQELFPDPATGRRREVDLVARLAVTTTGTEPWLALVHAEIESRDAAAPLRPRMYEYYRLLRDKHGLPVLPLAVLLRVGLEGLGVEEYAEDFLDFRALQFRYLYVGLPGLDGQPYLAGDNSLGVALATLMRLPGEQRPALTATALDRLVKSGENERRKFLLCECVQAYAPMTEQQRQELDRLLHEEPYEGVRDVVKTWFEQGEEAGEKRLIRRLLEKRFGPLSTAVRERLDNWPAEKLDDLGEALLTAQSLKELGLEE